ncbi:Uncharacterized membrane protein YcaP, DUF421 family [Anaerovirgula multivorans]|uniref:Uncharacterized membrane protein YcaP, DUF421 family n=1 Tax=Anaerovirgula multivorans TaxID=312168 RepID=A0A239EB52_9FIRM|nr:DUF421 domain-containing protein [Anaerovirgula multivorans]SNS41915.1 Uncharacterized membrane protein YcaP, DUF421 family [Anaerovirgula multivorans]
MKKYRIGVGTMLIVFTRALILYGLVVLVMRMMGKRQIAEMQPFELVITIMIADLAATPMENTGVPLLNGVIPIVTLLSAQVIVSYLSLKSETFREIVCGKPSIIIDKGNIVQSEVTRLRINMNDLLEQLRGKSYLNLSDVEYAILETNGQITIIPKAEKRNVLTSDLGVPVQPEELPITLIVDGKLIEKNLQKSGHNHQWIMNRLKQNNINNIEDVFFAFLSSERMFYSQPKEKTTKQGG